jgi:hypothetical protein
VRFSLGDARFDEVHARTLRPASDIAGGKSTVFAARKIDKKCYCAAGSPAGRNSQAGGMKIIIDVATQL